MFMNTSMLAFGIFLSVRFRLNQSSLATNSDLLTVMVDMVRELYAGIRAM